MGVVESRARLSRRLASTRPACRLARCWPALATTLAADALTPPRLAVVASRPLDSAMHRILSCRASESRPVDVQQRGCDGRRADRWQTPAHWHRDGQADADTTERDRTSTAPFDMDRRRAASRTGCWAEQTDTLPLYVQYTNTYIHTTVLTGLQRGRTLARRQLQEVDCAPQPQAGLNSARCRVQ